MMETAEKMKIRAVVFFIEYPDLNIYLKINRLGSWKYFSMGIWITTIVHVCLNHMDQKSMVKKMKVSQNPLFGRTVIDAILEILDTQILCKKNFYTYFNWERIFALFALQSKTSCSHFRSKSPMIEKYRYEGKKWS